MSASPTPAGHPATRIRHARHDEAGALASRLTALCHRSKAHWGYPPELLDRWAGDLRIDPTDIARDVVLVAETDDAATPTGPGSPDGTGLMLVGFARIGVVDPRIAQLHDLWVEPVAMGQGVGRALMEAAMEVARTLPAERLRIVADPNAEAFYARFGAVRVDEADSDVVAGRRLPILELELGPGRIAHDPAEPG